MALLVHLNATRGADLKLVQPDDIHRFLVAEGERCGRTTLSGTCSMLRGFLSYLYRHQLIATDLCSAVVAPRIYRHEQCPRFLTAAEIDKVLAAIDRNTSLGRRDYAMLLLLAVYGLRGIEVVRLRLGDFDWRSQRLHIRRRKAGNQSIYPLTVPVGEAVVAYLRSGRPKSPYREIFLANIAPFGRLSTGTLGSHVTKYMAKAGVQSHRSGAHTLRYSCAQRLLDEGMSLKTIGDYLGHSDPNSTQRYTKIALDQLRGVASGDGEDLLL